MPRRSDPNRCSQPEVAEILAKDLSRPPTAARKPARNIGKAGGRGAPPPATAKTSSLGKRLRSDDDKLDIMLLIILIILII